MREVPGCKDAYFNDNSIEAALGKPGTYRGVPYKGEEETEDIADRIVNLLRSEGLPIWQAKDVLRIAQSASDWEILK